MSSSSTQALVSDLTGKFHSVFKGDGHVRVVRAPGRVNLIGEHTDYNDGFVFPMAIEPEVRIACRERSDMKVRIASTRRAGEFVEFSLQDELHPHPEHKHWSNYLKGPAHFLKQAGVPLVGMDALIDNTLAEGSGLSSSAALEVAMVRSLLLLAGEDMEYSRVAQICQKAEHAFPKAPVGIMDMTASAGGKAGHAMLLDCRSLAVTYVPLPVDELRVVVMNTMVQHSLAGGKSEYAIRREQCEEAARHFNVKALRDLDMSTLQKGEKELPVVVYRRARHVVSEIARCLEAASALRDGNYERAGELMVASHVSLRDDYEVSCPELDFLADEAMKIKGVYGARMTGGGFGGCAVALCQPRAVEPLTRHIVERYKEHYGKTPDVLATAATDGAGEMK
jgi:galactokinase